MDSIILYLLRDDVFEINTTQQNTSNLNLTQSNILLIFQKKYLNLTNVPPFTNKAASIQNTLLSVYP